MKRTSKVISIILSVFMLMQMMTGVVFAASNVPTELHWDEEYGLTASYKTDPNVEIYLINFYKDGKLVDQLSDECDLKNDTREEYTKYGVVDIIEENGSGTYTFKVGECTETYEEYCETWRPETLHVSKWSEMSPGFVYTKPSAKLPTPKIISFANNDISASFTPNENIDYVQLNYYISWGGTEKVIVYAVHGMPKTFDKIYKEKIASVFEAFERIRDLYNNSDPLRFNEDKAVLSAAISTKTLHVNQISSSDESPMVFYGSDIGGDPEDKPIDRSVISEKYYDAAKVCYDLGLMPKIYENYNQNVTGGEFNTLYKALTGETIRKDADKELTFADVIVDLVDGLGYTPAVEYNGGRPLGSLLVASQQGLTKGVSLSKDSNVSYEQLAQIVYNSLETRLMKQISWGANPEYEITDDTRLYQLGYSKYTVNAEISGDNATVKGKVYNKANKKGIEADTQLTISDNDIKTYTDKGMKLYVKDGNILSGIPYYYARVKINNGDKETTSKNVLLNLEAYGYSKYKIGDGEYTAVLDSNTVEYTLDPISGDKTVTVDFANSDESKKISSSAIIKLINKHTVTYKVNGNVFETIEVDCGSVIPALDKTPSVDGFRFDGWKDIPETMPDEDIVVEAIMTDVSAAIATGSAGENAAWALSQEGVLTISGIGAVSELKDFSYDNLVATKSVVIGDDITSIGDYVLNDLYNCETVKIGKGLKTAGVQFMYGSKVSEVIVPANVAEIKEGFCGKNQSSGLKLYVYNKDLVGCNFISEGTLYGYSNSTLSAAATEKNLEFVSIDPDFAINNGADETTDKNVKISFNDYAKNDFKQYKINDGEYTNIDANDIDFVLDSADGEKTINITFKNDSYEISKTHKIIFNNKHKITFKADGEVVDERTFGCGAQIPVIDGTKAPAKEGYVFLEWNTLPKIMPDSDITVSALYLKKPETTLLDTILTEQEKAEGISVKSDITVADENENIELALANKYSKYTASIIINIDLSKGKDESFTPITETENLLTFTVDIPAEIQDKAEYIVLREHNGTVDALTTSKNADGEYIEVKDNTIIIHAKKFSAYQLLAKDADPTPSRRGGGGGSSSYTVKFETNGAPAIKSVSVSRNNVITAPTAPAKDGFVFDGWYTDKEFKTKFDFATKITKSMTLYAKWTEKAKTSIILTIGKKDADINGKTVANDVAPKIVNDRTMLPIRFIAEALGAKVDWIEESQTVKITAENIDISLVIGEDFATVNGEKIDLDSPSFIENDRTYLPIRFVSEKLGADVSWDDATQTVSITK